MKKYFLSHIRLAVMLCVSLFFSCAPEIEQPPEQNPNGSLENNSSSSFPFSSNSGKPDKSNASAGGKSSSAVQANNSSSSLQSSSSAATSSSSKPASSSSNNGGVAQQCSEAAGPVACYGKLKASGNKLVGSKTGSTAVQVRGVSLFWSNTGWGGDRFFTAPTVNAMVDSWKAEVIRVPIGYSEDGGYRDDPSNLTRVKTAINAAIAKGVYVIIDWHSHNAHNELAAATAFFNEMARTYGSEDNVIFEIYNEPTAANGGTWANIKSYANSIISTIRQYSDNLILVGTPNWDQDVDAAAQSQVSDPKNNIAYVFHFYAAEHTRALFESNVSAVLSAGYPVFVSEYGTVEPSGDGYHDAASTNAWHTYMDNNKISSCAWSVNDKYESSAFFGTGSRFDMSSWTSTSYMTASGQYIFNKLRTYANSAPWRGSGSIVITSSSSGNGGGGTTYYCDWGPRYYDPYHEDCGDDYCGGCYPTDDLGHCRETFGEVVSSCPNYYN